MINITLLVFRARPRIADFIVALLLLVLLRLRVVPPGGSPVLHVCAFGVEQVVVLRDEVLQRGGQEEVGLGETGGGGGVDEEDVCGGRAGVGKDL
jgi:hypothetical protein